MQWLWYFFNTRTDRSRCMLISSLVRTIYTFTFRNTSKHQVSTFTAMVYTHHLGKWPYLYFYMQLILIKDNRYEMPQYANYLYILIYLRDVTQQQVYGTCRKSLVHTLIVISNLSQYMNYIFSTSSKCYKSYDIDVSMNLMR